LLVGLAASVLAASLAGLVMTGHLSIRTSADLYVSPVPLWVILLPIAVALVLARVIPPRVASINPLEHIPRHRIRCELWVLIAGAVGYPVLVVVLQLVGTPRDIAGGPLKVIAFLVVPLLAFRALRGDGPKAQAIPPPADRMHWLAPVPAVLAWIFFAQLSPWTPPAPDPIDLPDPVTLAIISLYTLLTASVLEEVFYRGFLQTRLEALLGRWPAIAVTALLFAAMHIPSHVAADAVGVGLASIVVFQGTFGLLLGYMWSRYRNLWAPIAIHVAVNLIYVDLLADLLYR
jgi:membrane protease YdiL (CAAX protease family)